MKGPRSLTIVIKLGTSSIVDEKTHEPQLSNLSNIVETSVKLHHEGHKVVIVSSGAIGLALWNMKLDKRPKHLPRVQALAAIGQCGLMATWEKLFAMKSQTVAQILLTRNDIADRTQYLNAQNTFAELLNMGVIPIVNENDTLSVSEIKFGDNDTLSAITAGMVQADYLFLMTDVDCLYDTNPRNNPNAKAIEVVEDISELIADVSSAGSSVGTGGMATKIVAARLATSAGVTTVITRSSHPGNISHIIKYVQAQKAVLPNNNLPLSPTLSSTPILKAPLHTRFLPDPHPIRDRRFWLLYGLAPHGTLYIDEGASRALSNKTGLLPIGVKRVEGTFGQQEAVRLIVIKTLPLSTTPEIPSSTPNHSRPHTPPPKQDSELQTEIGRALVNYSSSELQRIKGLHSLEIQKVLGYADSEYVAYRENVSLFKSHRDGSGSPVPTGVSTPLREAMARHEIRERIAHAAAPESPQEGVSIEPTTSELIKEELVTTDTKPFIPTETEEATRAAM